MPARRSSVRVAVLACGALLALAATGDQDRTGREVVFVANAEGGTVSVLDSRTFAVLHELDVVPDGAEASVGDDPVQGSFGQQLTEAAGGENLAQDQDLSPDGRTLYVSRGHRGDVAAFDLISDDLLWKTPIDGLRSDHATLSPDGDRLFVSSLTSDVVQVFDTATGEELDRFATGEWPHDNHVSHDGRRLYNASIGNIITPPESRDLRVATPGVPSPYQVRVVDIDTLELRSTFEFEAGVRPFAVTADETRIYAQLSEFHGVVEIDASSGEILRRLELPIDDGVTEDDYSFEAPHHGLALSDDESTLCLAGRASDYVAFVDATDLTATAIVDVDDAPSWAVTTLDGDSCVVANTRGDTVSFLSYDELREVARVAVGDGPKHLEMGRVPDDVVSAWAGSADPDDDPGGRGGSSDGGSLPDTGAGTAVIGIALLSAAWAARRRAR